MGLIQTLPKQNLKLIHFLPKGEKKSYDFKIARQGEVTLLHIPTSPSESAKSHLHMPSRWRDEHTP